MSRLFRGVTRKPVLPAPAALHSNMRERVVPSCDWAWRPEAWQNPGRCGVTAPVANGTFMAPGVTLHHDCPSGAVSIDSGADGTVWLKTDGFAGSFLSLAIALPGDVTQTLSRRDLVTVRLDLGGSAACPVFLRLNLRHGARVRRLTENLCGRPQVTFDLFYADLPSGPAQSAWLDLIVNPAQGVRLGLADLTLARGLRGQV